MLFSKPEIIFLSAFVLMFGGYRIYTAASGKEGRYSKGHALTWFLCAGLDVISALIDLSKGLSPADPIPHLLIALIFAVLGLLELRGIKRQDKA